MANHCVTWPVWDYVVFGTCAARRPGQVRVPPAAWRWCGSIDEDGEHRGRPSSPTTTASPAAGARDDAQAEADLVAAFLEPGASRRDGSGLASIAPEILTDCTCLVGAAGYAKPITERSPLGLAAHADPESRKSIPDR